MRRNRSFVFFQLVEDFDPDLGPVAGAGVPLTPLRSIAIDRTMWAYGLPFWIDAELPWADETPRPFRRLMIAQDTGSAIVGAARADLFFGSGDAGRRARRRHSPSGRVHRASAARGRPVKDTPPRPQRLRRLSDEEIALWTEVARSVARRRGATLPDAIESRQAPPGPLPRLQPPPNLRPARPAKPSAPPLAPIERRLKRELSRGRAAIDGALDLHGLTQAEAHQALRGFLRHSQARGARLVIIVTGKGASAGRGRPVAERTRRAEAAHPSMAARARPALGRARLRGSRTRAWRVRRALCAAQTPPGSFGAALAARLGLERELRTEARPLASLLLGAAFPVQLMRRRVALDPDVAHGLRAELDRPACQDPSPVAGLAPCAARDQVNVAGPALHSPNPLVGANGSDRRNECDSRENSEVLTCFAWPPRLVTRSAQSS